MLAGLADKLVAARHRVGWRWKIWAVVLVIVFAVVAFVITWWRGKAAERRAHESFVASIDARRAADAARAEQDLAKLDELREEAHAAQERADVAVAAAKASLDRHGEALAAIDRVRSWDDVGRTR